MGTQVFEARCHALTGDFLDVQDESDTVNKRMLSFAATNAEGHVNSVFLDEPTVRALFNKLGIWLHKGGS